VNDRQGDTVAVEAEGADAKFRGRLFRKYVLFFMAVVCVALISNGILEFFFYLQEYKGVLVRLQRAQAELVAARIGQLFDEIESQVGWTVQRPWSAGALDEWRFDLVRLLQQVPAVTQVAKLDASGREQLRLSRAAPEVVGSGADFSADPIFLEAIANKKHYGPVDFGRDAEPHLTLGMTGASGDAGVTVVELDLTFLSDSVAQVNVGTRGQAYLVDAQGRLIAHPDRSLVLRKTDLSQFPQVQAARAAGAASLPDEEQLAEDIQGRRVLVAHAPIAPFGWWLFIELPVEEGYAFLYASTLRSGAHFLAALALAALTGLFLARRMSVPVRALQLGAARIGSGDLGQRISIKTGDELEALGNQFNTMAAQLQDSYATLERKVEARTHELALANLAKSRFLAAASHDLRQPLHALGLFVAELRAQSLSAESLPIVERIDASVAAMNELFSALLDISKLDAGVLAPELTDFPIAQLLVRLEATFAAAARAKGLSLRVVTSSAWVRSDVILLERILLNLVANAVRYTADGGVVVGCRRRGGQLRIEVWDSGPGIPDDQRRDIFGEFYQLAGPERDRHAGLGLGLAIVDRLGRLLDHPIALTSTLGKGSCFAVLVPAVAARTADPAPSLPQPAIASLAGTLVVVIDDDALVLEAMGRLLRSWDCRVVSADSASAVLAALGHDGRPDLIISDYRLSHGQTGIETIEQLRAALRRPIPAFLISGDTDPERLRDARAGGYHLLHKPVRPMALRAMVSQLLKQPASAGTVI
jgi:signal transduction histidine kinase